MVKFTYLGMEFEPYRNLTTKEREIILEAVTDDGKWMPPDYSPKGLYAAAKDAGGGYSNVTDLYYHEGKIGLPGTKRLFYLNEPIVSALQ